MKRPKELKRNYIKADRIMLEQSQGFHDLLAENLAFFTAKYPFIDAAYLLKFQSDIDAANAVMNDREIVEEISDDASVMAGFIAVGKAKYMNLITIARFTYPDNPTMINRFGLPEYEEYSRVHTLFPILLDQAHDLANEPAIKALLLAKGLTATDITDIDAVSTSIKNENKLLFSEKKKRSPITQERVSKSNVVWGTMSQISDCSKILYFDNYAMYHSFLLYPGEEGGPTPPAPPVPPVV